MFDKTPVRSRRRRNSDLHTPLSATPKICKTTPRRTLAKTPIKSPKTAPPKQRLRTPRRTLAQSGKSPEPRGRWSVGSRKSASQGPASARTEVANTPVRGTPRTPNFPPSPGETLPKTATPSFGGRSGGTPGFDFGTCSTDRSKSETLGSHGSHRHDFGFAPGVEDTLAFQAPSTLWHKRLSNESDGGLSPSPNTVPQLQESTEMIMGFSPNARFNPDGEEGGPPTEALFATGVLGGRLSPVQEEEGSASFNWNQSQSAGTTAAVEGSEAGTEVGAGSEAGEDAVDAMKGLAITEKTQSQGADQGGTAQCMDEDKVSKTSSHGEVLGKNLNPATKASGQSPLQVGGSRASLPTGWVTEREARGRRRGSESKTMSERFSPAPKTAVARAPVVHSPSPVKNRESHLSSLNLSADPGSWEGDLRKYLEARIAVSPETLQRRVTLANALHSGPSSSSDWWNFLFHEECLDEEGDGFELDVERVLAGGVPPSLHTMYLWAIGLVTPDSQDYVKIWIGYCRQVWWRNENEGAVFLHSGLRRAHGKNQVCLLEEIVSMECAAGRESRALSVVEGSMRRARLSSQSVEELADIASRIKNREYTTYQPRCNISGNLGTIRKMLLEHAA
ncbi:hypothetical protein BSKO_03406 [Bryopsis sp. KO-2023]|nr:hypothetical protein BSKO_03406 [Bryopsis sp. KO-2023]